MKIEAIGVSKSFLREGKGTNMLVAVSETDFSLPEGTFTILKGRSGSGKSTLLNMLAGLLAPTTGRVLLDGRDLAQLGDDELSRLRNAKIGIIPQGQTGLECLTVLENVMLPQTVYGERDGLRERAERLLDELGISHLRDARPKELSGGEMRRMSIARALAGSPAMILADEPTSDLDDENTALVFRMLREAADGGAAALVVTHEPDAEKYADKTYRMSAGAIAEEG